MYVSHFQLSSWSLEMWTSTVFLFDRLQCTDLSNSDLEILCFWFRNVQTSLIYSYFLLFQTSIQLNGSQTDLSLSHQKQDINTQVVT